MLLEPLSRFGLPGSGRRQPSGRVIPPKNHKGCEHGHCFKHIHRPLVCHDIRICTARKFNESEDGPDLFANIISTYAINQYICKGKGG